MADGFKDRLRLVRGKSGKTQEEIASLLNIKRSTYGEYERGKIMPPIDKVEQLAKLLETTPQYLLGWESEKKPMGSETQSWKIYNMALKMIKGEKLQDSDLSNVSYMTQQLEKWNNALNGAILTEEEFDEVTNYVRYVLSKRNNQ